jgi:hypothetical protein
VDAQWTPRLESVASSANRKELISRNFVKPSDGTVEPLLTTEVPPELRFEGFRGSDPRTIPVRDVLGIA